MLPLYSSHGLETCTVLRAAILDPDETMTTFKAGVCESPGVPHEAAHLFLLNEMPFGPWVASRPAFDEALWKESLAAHRDGMANLSRLGATYVAGTQPVERGTRMNEAFLWSGSGLEPVHTKQYFPDEEGYYEARWFKAGDRNFRIADAGGLRCGFLICTELMFNEHARRYGREGAHVILVPRAVGVTSLDRWLVAMRMAAIVSGCYVLSSNRGGVENGQVFGGRGWIIDPRGDVVAETSAETPVVYAEIDTDVVAKAQREYPCYVRE